MITIFRKTRQKLLSENNMGKYFKYALGEIILVMVGILLALQVNNWNESRKDRIRENAILKELHRDFKKNLQQFNEIVAVHEKSLRGSNRFKKFINHPNPIQVRDSIGKYYFLAFNGVSYNPSNGIVTSLISSGEYKLIKNDTLRNYLISWKDALEDYTEEEQVSNRLWSEKIEPFLIDNGDLANLTNPINFKLITTMKFKNLTQRHIFLLRNILRSIDQEPLQNHLNEIVRLSKTE
ncbi:DUF6090 family protein [Flavobacteriaceae bacterium S356]|uniref:DUF6090 family protein n=1 Tax=Asprobacillus argus TaxID=3076534 RepID=A0ABU3LIR0_9FLAO|nr:DUF6090 family protein [Flavobacteriaceae bacterium S356]